MAGTITVTGVILDEQGNPMPGYKVELHSTPQVVVTDANGKFTFRNVSLEDHMLYVRDADGNIIDEFAVNFELGDVFGWNMVGDDVDVTIQTNTIIIDFTIVMDDGNAAIENIEKF